eukprot:jgi/Chrzof1/999/Cz01g36100.t1
MESLATYPGLPGILIWLEPRIPCGWSHSWCRGICHRSNRGGSHRSTKSGAARIQAVLVRPNPKKAVHELDFISSLTATAKKDAMWHDNKGGVDRISMLPDKLLARFALCSKQHEVHQSEQQNQHWLEHGRFDMPAYRMLERLLPHMPADTTWPPVAVWVATINNAQHQALQQQLGPQPEGV